MKIMDSYSEFPWVLELLWGQLYTLRLKGTGYFLKLAGKSSLSPLVLYTLQASFGQIVVLFAIIRARTKLPR